MIDLVQLRSFVAVERGKSFTLAADQLGLRQSTVSQHIQRLEKHLACRLFWRDTHTVMLTAEGESLLPYARQMLHLERQASAQFDKSRLRGTLRFGVSEDLVSGQLPLLLEEFADRHPSVDLQLTIALSNTLYDMQERSEIDLVMAKRRLGETIGTAVCRDQLVWLARDPEIVLSRPVLPVITFPWPSITRAILMESLATSKLEWRIVFTCQSLSGLTAAARAGMGVMVQPLSLIPDGLKVIAQHQLPGLEDVEFVLRTTKGAESQVVEALSHDITTRFSGGLIR